MHMETTNPKSTLSKKSVWSCHWAYVVAGLLTAVSLNGQSTTTIGQGQATNTATRYPAAFGAFHSSARHQFLYPAEELQAAGLPAGAVLTQAAFHVVEGAGIILRDWQVALRFTSASDPLANAWLSAPVMGASNMQDHTVTIGWNEFDMSAPVVWDGQSHLVIETCFSNPAWSSNALALMTLGGPGPARSRWLASSSVPACGGNAGSGSSSARPVLRLVWGPFTACAQASSAGGLAASPAVPCLGAQVMLSMAYAESGITNAVTWQRADAASGPWSTLSVEGSSISIAHDAAAWYRTVATCPDNGGQTASEPLFVPINQNHCQCGPYAPSAAASNMGPDLLSVTIGTVTKSSACNALASGPGSLAGRYSNHTTTTPSISAQRGQVLPLEAVMSQFSCSGSWNGPQSLAVFADWNQDGDFDDPSERLHGTSLANHTVNASIAVPGDAALGSTRLRLVLANSANAAQIAPTGEYAAGETEDYCISVAAGQTCSTPAPQLAILASRATACPSQPSVHLSLAPSLPIESGWSFQWQAAAHQAGPWVDIGDDAPALATEISAPTWFRCAVACSYGGSQATSDPLLIPVASGDCACRSYPTAAANSPQRLDILRVRVGDLVMASACGETAPGSGSAGGSYSNYAEHSTQPVLNRGSIVPWELWIGSCGEPVSHLERIYIDWNQDGDFSDADEQVASTSFTFGNGDAVGSFLVPWNAVLGSTRMRVRSTTFELSSPMQEYAWGESEDYCVLVADAECPASPGWQIVTNEQQPCPGSALILSLQMPSGYPVADIQWQSAPQESGPWSDIGASSASIELVAGGSSWYRCVVTCPGGALYQAAPVHVPASPSPCACSSYPASQAGTATGMDLWSVVIGNMSNASPPLPGSGLASAGSLIGRYTNYTGNTPAQLAPGALVPASLIASGPNGYDVLSGAALFIDWNQDGDFGDDGERVLERIPLQVSDNQHRAAGHFYVPESALAGMTRARFVLRSGSSLLPIEPHGPYTDGETEDYCVEVLPSPPCGPTAVQAQVAGPLGLVCPGSQSILSIAYDGPYPSGLSHAWQSGPTPAGPWSGIGSDAPQLTIAPAESAWYRCEITCANGGTAMLTEPVEVQVQSNSCACAPYPLQVPGALQLRQINRVSIGSWQNTSDPGALAPGPGSIAGRYSNYAGLSPPALLPGQSVSLNVQLSGEPAPWHGAVLTDWNEDGDFLDASELIGMLYLDGWQNQSLNVTLTVPPFIASGSKRLRILASNEFFDPRGTPASGETEDYCLTILPGPSPCSGAPIAAPPTIASASNCLSAAAPPGLSPANGYTLQWQWSATGTDPWNDFGDGQPLQALTTGLGPWFRYAATCLASQLSATSPSVEAQHITCLCLPYGMSAASAGNENPDITAIAVGNFNQASACGATAPGAGSLAGRYSSYLGTGPVLAPGQTVSVSAFISDCSPGGQQLLPPSFTHTVPMGFALFIDWNRDGDFDDAGERAFTSQPFITTATVAGSIHVPLDAQPGTTRMRAVAASTQQPWLIAPVGGYAKGETEDYCITILPPPPCSGVPDPGAINTTSDAPCPGEVVTLSLTGAAGLGSGASVEWRTGPSEAGPWSAIAGEGATLRLLAGSTAWYVAAATCASSGSTSATAPIAITATDDRCKCTGAAIPDINPEYGLDIVLAQFGTVSNGSTMNELAPGMGSNAGAYANYSGHVAALPVERGDTVTFSLATQAGGFGYAANQVSAYADWNQDGDFDDHQEQASAGVNGSAISGWLAVPLHAASGGIRVRFEARAQLPSGTWIGEAEDYCLDVAPTAACSGAPQPGPVIAVQSDACPGSAVWLQLASIWEYGSLFQWERASSSIGPWQPFGASASAVNDSPAQTTWYRCTLTCVNSGLTTLTDPIEVPVVHDGCACGAYQMAGSSTGSGPDLVFVGIGDMSNASACDALAPGTGSIAGRYSSYVGHISPAIMTIGQPTPFNLLADACGSASATSSVGLWVDWNQDGDFSDADERVLSSAMPFGAPGLSGSFQVPAHALTGFTRVRVVHGSESASALTPHGFSFSSNEAEDYCAEVRPALPCDGAFAPGATIASLAAACTGQQVTLSLATVLPPQAGYGFQWQRADTPSGPWLDFGAGAPSASATISGDAWFRCRVSCAAGSSANSSSVFVAVLPPCVCREYPASAATAAASDDITSVSLGTLAQTSACSAIAPGPGSVAGKYSNYTGLATAAALPIGQPVAFSAQASVCGATHAVVSLAVFIDWNQDGDFADADERAFAAASPNAASSASFTGAITAPWHAAQGTTRMRLVLLRSSNPSSIAPTGSYNSGETEDYCVEVVLAPCEAAPGLGATQASLAYACPGSAVGLSMATPCPAAGRSFSWEEATSANGPWTPLGIASTTAMVNPAATRWYRCVATCDGNGQFTASDPVMVPFHDSPCACAGHAITEESAMAGAPNGITLVAMNGWSNPSMLGELAPGLGSVVNKFSNYALHAAAPVVTPGQLAHFSLAVNTASPYQRTSRTAIYIDWNQDGDWTDPGELAHASGAAMLPHTFSGVIAVPTDAIAGTTRMRIVALPSATDAMPLNPTAMVSNGEVEDYCLDVLPPLPCAASAQPGATLLLGGAPCAGDTITLGFSGMGAMDGAAFTWEQAPSASGPWSAIPGSGPTLRTLASGTSWYRCAVSCAGPPIFSTPLLVPAPASSCACGPYPQSGTTAGAIITSVSIGAWSAASLSGAVAPGPGSLPDIYSDYTGALQPATVTIAATSSAALSISPPVLHSSGALFIDWNQDGDFADGDERVLSGAFTAQQPVIAGSFSVPATALPGITRARAVACNGCWPVDIVNGTGFAGETEDYCVNVAAAEPCSGAPPSTSVSASILSACPGDPVNLTYDGEPLSGYSYQWQTAETADGPWLELDCSGPVCASAAASSAWYRLLVTCGASSSASLPVQIIRAGDACQCAPYGSSSASAQASLDLIHVSLAGLANSSACLPIAPGGALQANRHTDFCGTVSAPLIAVGETVPFTATAGCVSIGMAASLAILIDWNQDGDFNDPFERAHESSTVTVPFTFSGTVNVPLIAAHGTTRMRVILGPIWSPGPVPSIGPYTIGETEDYCIAVVGADVCPTPSVSVLMQGAGQPVCPGAPLTLRLAQALASDCHTHLWQSAPSPDGPWMDAGIADTLALIAWGSTWYRCTITSIATGASETTPPARVAALGSPCSCAAYGTSAAISESGPLIIRASAGSGPMHASACNQPAPGPGSLTNRYGNHCGTAQPFIVTAGETEAIGMQVAKCSGSFPSAGAAVFVDWNQDGDFADMFERVQQYDAMQPGTIVNGWFHVPTTAVLGVTRIRFVVVQGTAASAILPVGTYAAGETEDHCLEVRAAGACASVPQLGETLISMPDGCASPAVLLSCSGLGASTAGLAFHWEYANSESGPWSSFGDGLPQQPAALPPGTWFRCTATCLSTGSSATSTPAMRADGDTPCNCLAYPASSATLNSGPDIIGVHVGDMSSASACVPVLPAHPASTQGRYSGYMASRPIALVPLATPTPVSVALDPCSSPASLSSVAIYVDWSQDGDFLDADELCYSTGLAPAPSTLSASIIPPMNAPLGITRLRVVCMAQAPGQGMSSLGGYFEGETEDYCIEVGLSTDLSQEEAAGARFVIWPNPNADGRLFVAITGVSPNAGWAAVELLDALGRKVLQTSIPVHGGESRAVLVLPSDLGKGAYVVRMRCEGASAGRRLIIQ